MPYSYYVIRFLQLMVSDGIPVCGSECRLKGFTASPLLQ
ncbi:Hypothetical protein NGK_2399 [Neisseria gonorrhoeae NCCP11945]|uniref:Uncharacterized protein n=1 Tax=Neisseria gonorrhoeae (strain NCCP11945) TaxID=521006 RepID=B4RPX6_NEIG2|nr:Hypothetical protein NGK_2399 [Neisseria gonorrhoeae NCCP11945]